MDDTGSLLVFNVTSTANAIRRCTWECSWVEVQTCQSYYSIENPAPSISEYRAGSLSFLGMLLSISARWRKTRGYPWGVCFSRSDAKELYLTSGSHGRNSVCTVLACNWYFRNRYPKSINLHTDRKSLATLAACLGSLVIGSPPSRVSQLISMKLGPGRKKKFTANKLLVVTARRAGEEFPCP